MNSLLNIKNVLEIILKSTKKNANILANTYLLKDESIISKWKRNTVIPKSNDIERILEFVFKESTESQRKIMRDELEKLIRQCPIQNEFKEIILKNEDFGQFLKEVISVSISDDDEVKRKDVFTAASDDFCDIPSINSHAGNNTRMYRGTMEFDMVVPEGKDALFAGVSSKSEIEITGKVNLTPKSKKSQVTELFRKKSVLGTFMFCVVVSTVLLAAMNVPGREIAAKDSKVYVNDKENFVDPGKTYASGYISESTPVPSISLIPSPTPKPSCTPQKSTDNETEVKKENGKSGNDNGQYNSIEVNNNTIYNNVYIQGDSTITIQGEDLAVSIDNN